MRLLMFVVAFLSITFSSEAKKIEGEIAFNDHIEKVIFKIPTDILSGKPAFEKIQHEVDYIDAEGKKKIIYPTDARAIKFYIQGEKVVMFSCQNQTEEGRLDPFGRERVFMRAIVYGPLTLYEYAFRSITSATNATGNVSALDAVKYKYVLQHTIEPLKKIKDLNFRKDMEEYLSDCPEVVELIHNRDLRKKDIQAIVEFYNSNCK